MITNLLDAANESQLAKGHLVTKEQQLDLLGRWGRGQGGGRGMSREVDPSNKVSIVSGSIVFFGS